MVEILADLLSSIDEQFWGELAADESNIDKWKRLIVLTRLPQRLRERRS